jgi:hypothetical protein
MYPLDGLVILCDNTQAMPVLLRHWRQKRGYSVRELARRAKVGFVTVSRIENGHISPTWGCWRSWPRRSGLQCATSFRRQGGANQSEGGNVDEA